MQIQILKIQINLKKYQICLKKKVKKGCIKERGDWVSKQTGFIYFLDKRDIIDIPMYLLTWKNLNFLWIGITFSSTYLSVIVNWTSLPPHGSL